MRAQGGNSPRKWRKGGCPLTAGDRVTSTSRPGRRGTAAWVSRGPRGAAGRGGGGGGGRGGAAGRGAEGSARGALRPLRLSRAASGARERTEILGSRERICGEVTSGTGKFTLQ